MKRIFKLTACLMIALTVCFGGVCTHTHDEDCGYNSQTESGCEHIHLLNEWVPPIG